MRITFRPQLTDNLLVADPDSPNPDSPDPKVLRIQEHDTVVVTKGSPAEHELYDVVREGEGEDLVLKRPGAAASLALKLDKHRVRLLTVDVDIERPIIRPKRPKERYDPPETREGFSFHPKHANALTSYFADKPNSRMLALAVPFAIYLEASPLELDSGAEVAASLLGMNVVRKRAEEALSQQTYQLEKGSDGSLPDAGAYQGNGAGMAKSGLAAFEDLEDISIIAAPGVTLNYGKSDALATRAQTIQGYLINHCEKMRYRVAVLDSANEHTLADVREHRSKMDTTRAAFYYPWVTILDPITVEELDLPPSGFMAGIYARNDVENGVHKAPANEVVRLAIGFELPINKAQQDVLNPEGINCLRFFEGRGYRVWGARTISSDSEWKYINVRRYFVYLERSIERGTQWVVFENNTEHLWNDVRLTVEDFLYNEWRSGHLMGTKPEEAYFVRCDRSTMTQNDIDNGRLICLIGVAPVKPAEFVIFRIGQWTADRRA
jgi:hypothetical protein